jgi:hypothetical protein
MSSRQAARSIRAAREVAMRVPLALGLFVTLLPAAAGAQVFQLPTPPPQVNAAASEWQINGDPVYYEGSFYYPTGPTVFFDGNVMSRTGVFRSIPLFQDRTLEPFSVVFVPIGGTVMRPYEKLRDNELAGTVGSRVPSFTTLREPDGAAASASLLGTPDVPFRMPPFTASSVPAAPEAVGTRGPSIAAVAGAAAARDTTPIVQPSPRPTSNDGIWIEFDGARWFAAGRAESFTADRFTPIGEYRGFPVYRSRDVAGAIYVLTVRDGAVTPYRQK